MIAPQQSNSMFGKACLALFVLSVLVLPVAHAVQPVPTVRCGPQQGAAQSCCDPSSPADAPSDAPIDDAPAPDHPGDSPCDCPGCALALIASAPIIAPVDAGLPMFTDSPRLMLPITAERAEAAALGVAIQPPIA